MFTVDADVLNNRAMELSSDGRWAEGQRFLMRSLCMSAEQTWRVMSGETHLVNTGASDVAFAEDVGQEPLRDEDRRYAEYVRRKWTGILATNNGHYQPYAYVTTTGACKAV